MFSFGRGKKKEEDKKQPPAPTGQSAAPPAADLFGGMQQRTRRRKKGQDDDDSKSMAASERPTDDRSTTSAEPKQEEAAAPKPFFSSFNFATTGNVDMTGMEDDPETAAVKKRLERFYSHYNPSKLASIDDTVKRFKGRETALFDALVQKYGPEPGEQGAETTPTKSTGARSKASVAGSDHVSASPPTRKKEPVEADVKVPEPAAEAPASGFAEDATGFGGGGGFGDAEAGGFSTEDGGFGDAGADGGFGGGGFGDDAQGGFGDAFGDNGGAEGFGGGFGDEGTAPEEGGFGTFDQGETDPSDANAGFGDGEEPPAAESQTAEATAAAWNAPSDAPVSAANGTVSSASSSSSDDLTDLERQDRVIADSREQVSASRSDLTNLLIAEAARSAERRRLIAEYTTLESTLDRLTAEEDWEGADAANGKMAQVAAEIDRLSDRSGEAATVSAANAVETALGRLAQTYAQQRSLLQDTRAEVERKTTNYINESKSKLESATETVRADLEKARRNLEYTQQEVTRVAQRREKIEDKIRDQTKEIREERSKVADQAAALEDEVAELERTLAAKRKALLERKGQLHDMDHQLGLIEDNHRESITRVTAEEEAEQAKLQTAQGQVERLTAAQEANARAEAELAEETEAMHKELEEHAVRIRRFERNTATLNGPVVTNFNQFFAKAIADVVAMRSSEGSDCLSSGPHQAGSQGGPLAAVQAKLASARAAVEANIGQESTLRRRVEEIAQCLPSLEAAKKAAAAAKQFKEASAKTAEIKRLNDEKADCMSKCDALLAESPALAKEVEQLEAEKSKEVANHRAKIRVFTDRYAETLRCALAAIQRAEHEDVGQTASLYYIDTMPLQPKDAGAVWVNSHPDADDPFRAAAMSFIDACFDELASLLECDVDDLKAGTTGSPTTVATETPVASEAPAAPTEEPTQAASEAAPDDDETAAETEAPASEEEMREELSKLQELLEEAMAAEDFDECDRLQTRITTLEEKLS